MGEDTLLKRLAIVALCPLIAIAFGIAIVLVVLIYVFIGLPAWVITGNEDWVYEKYQNVLHRYHLYQKRKYEKGPT